MAKNDDPGIGHNSLGEQLRLFVERYERLAEEKKGMQDDMKDVLLEAKSTGYDPAMIRYVVKMRTMEKAKRDELLALQETYLAAIGLA